MYMMSFIPFKLVNIFYLPNSFLALFLPRDSHSNAHRQTPISDISLLRRAMNRCRVRDAVISVSGGTEHPHQFRCVLQDPAVPRTLAHGNHDRRVAAPSAVLPAINNLFAGQPLSPARWVPPKNLFTFPGVLHPVLPLSGRGGEKGPHAVASSPDPQEPVLRKRRK